MHPNNFSRVLWQLFPCTLTTSPMYLNNLSCVLWQHLLYRTSLWQLRSCACLWWLGSCIAPVCELVKLALLDWVSLWILRSWITPAHVACALELRKTAKLVLYSFTYLHSRTTHCTSYSFHKNLQIGVSLQRGLWCILSTFWPSREKKWWPWKPLLPPRNLWLKTTSHDARIMALQWTSSG